VDSSFYIADLVCFFRQKVGDPFRQGGFYGGGFHGYFPEMSVMPGTRKTGAAVSKTLEILAIS
jgi:hypothetical protein